MSVAFNAALEYLYNNSGSPNANTFSFSCWIYVKNIDVAGVVLAVYNSPSYSDWVIIYIRSATGTPSFHSSAGSFINGSAFSLNRWYHLGGVKVGTTGSIYRNGRLNVTDTTLTASPTANAVSMGDTPDSSEPFTGRLAAVKFWSGMELSNQEMLEESRYMIPIRPGAWFSNPMTDFNYHLDKSGRNHHMTVGGTLNEEENPPIPWAPSYSRRIYWFAEEPPAVGGWGALLSESRNRLIYVPR